MVLQPFQHHRPQSLDEALELLARHGDDAALYAGGTEILLALKARVLRYAHMIDIKRIDALRGVVETTDEIVIGALSTHFTLARDEAIRRLLPAYARLSDGVANIRVRAQGTLGGNLCFAEPHADPPTLLCAMGAMLTLRGPSSERTVAMADFIEGEFTTVRAADEILCNVRVPMPVDGSVFAYHSFGHLERPAVSVAVGLVAADAGPRYSIFAGALTSAPVRLDILETALAGVPPAQLGEAVARCAEEAMTNLETSDDLLGSADYKRHIATILLGRACQEIAAGVREARA